MIVFAIILSWNVTELFFVCEVHVVIVRLHNMHSPSLAIYGGGVRRTPEGSSPTVRTPEGSSQA